MPDGVIDANFYRAASRVSDEVAHLVAVSISSVYLRFLMWMC